MLSSMCILPVHSKNLKTIEEINYQNITQQTSNRPSKETQMASVLSMFALLLNLVEMPIITKQNSVKPINL